MLGKINVSVIIRDHLATLRAANRQQVQASDVIWFCLAPIAVASILVAARVELPERVVEVLATAIAILGGLLFNLLLLIYDLLDKEGDTSARTKRRELLREVFSNISFLVLLAVGLLVSLLVRTMLPTSTYLLPVAVEWLVFFGVALFFFTTLMVLKRVHVLLKQKFEG